MTDNIKFDWQSMPGKWMATRENYCGCGECKYPAGFGRTKEEAEADLIEMEAVATCSTSLIS